MSSCVRTAQKARFRPLPVDQVYWSVVPVAASGHSCTIDETINPPKSVLGLCDDILGLVWVGEISLKKRK